MPRGPSTQGLGLSRGGALLSAGMLVMGIAFSGWWASHTLLDPTRTERVAHTVLADAEIRDYLAGKVEPVIAQASPAVAQALSAQAGGTALPAGAAGAPQVVDDSAAQRRLADVLGDPAIDADLETFVGDVHRRVIGIGTGPVTLSASTVHRLVSAAVPTLPPAEVDKIPPVDFTVPHATALTTGRHSVADHWWQIGALGLVMVIAGLVMTDDHRRAARTVGKWLIGLSVVQLIVLWVIPVYVVPQVSDSPWTHVVSQVARALNSGLVVGLIVIAAAGVLLLFVDLFLKRSPESRSPSAT